MEKLDPITREERFMAAAAGDAAPLKPITRKEKFLARIAETGGGGTGGAQADYLAKEGEPGYILNRDKIQEKICGTEMAFIVPEQECVYDEDSESFMAQGNGTLTAGNTYNVTYNGTSYTCECVAVQGEGGVAVPMLGNIDALTGEGDNGMPFVIADYAVAGMPGVFMVMPLDGAETVTLSIEGEVVTPIQEKFVTNAMPYYIEITGSGTDDNPYVCNRTVEEVVNAAKSGRSLQVRITASGDGIVLQQIYYVEFIVLTGDGTNYKTGDAEFTRLTNVGYSQNWLVLSAQEDGTYLVQMGVIV